MPVRYTRTGGLGRLTLDGPPSNTIDLARLEELDRCLDEVAADTASGVVVVDSAVPGFFCGGADVDLIRDSGATEQLAFVRAVQALLDRVEELPQLTVAVIAGHATGGGYELALACDLRLAVNGDYRVGLPEAALGLLPAGGGTQRLVRLLGRGPALRLMCTATLVGPAEAARLGLVDQLVEPAALDAELDALGRRAAVVPPSAVAAIKRCVRAAGSLAPGLATEAREIGGLLAGEETRRRLAAFDSARRRLPEA